MKRSDLNHLRRLVAWVSCEIGQSPDELVATMRNLAERGITTDDAGKARMVQAHDAARSVPKYVRDAVKALGAYARAPGEVLTSSLPFRAGRMSKLEVLDILRLVMLAFGRWSTQLTELRANLDRNSYVVSILDQHVKAEAHKTMVRHRMLRGNPYLPDGAGNGSE